VFWCGQMRKLWAFAEGADGFVVETGIADAILQVL
jgi:hypothetical protein